MRSFICDFYYVRCLNLYQGNSAIGKLIQRLEHWGYEWESSGAIGSEDEEEEKARQLLRDRERRGKERDVELGCAMGLGLLGVSDVGVDVREEEEEVGVNIEMSGTGSVKRGEEEELKRFKRRNSAAAERNSS